MYRLLFKRLIDIIASAILLCLASPLLLLTALGLYFSNNRRDVFFLQRRPGLHGKIFRIIKFKTMNDAKDRNGNLLPDADRITKVGKLVRTTSLDELPQLINVLKGEMSLIGPRPLLPEYLSLYSTEQARRHEVRPGITGWAQCHGRNAISWKQKLAYDVWYVDNISLKTDVKVLWLTFKAVIHRSGISQEGHATAEPFNGDN
ncbi:sugar transferase [Ihuprevotella massiliensis]|jgi:bacterial sugar transferase|uniref:sugar transferase n=1 Tax=Ihuprevotella massiliensis TaxID=1852368 RepID=UPI00094E0FDD